VCSQKISPTDTATQKNSGVVDMPIQIMLGALLILETINLECDYPYLHSLGIKITMDWKIHKLQCELEKKVCQSTRNGIWK